MSSNGQHTFGENGNQDMTSREKISEMHKYMKRMDRIHTIVLGDPEAERPGLVHDVKELKEADKKRGKIYIFLSSLSAGIAFLLKLIYDYITGKHG